MRRRTPQEKKRLSLVRDRRNVYGEAPHAARKNIPLRKALRNRSKRRFANQHLKIVGPIPPEEGLEALESQIKSKSRDGWKKYADAPLEVVLQEKLRRRRIMRENGGRRALITRNFVLREESE